MQDRVSTIEKKRLFIGAGLAALVVVAIATGIYATQQANANQPSSNVVVPGETDMHIDLQVNDLMAEADTLADLTEMVDGAMSRGQQGDGGASNSNVQVRVNGTSIDTPENGIVHKQITTQDGSTKIDFWSHSSTTSGESMDRSSINVDVDSSVEMRNNTQE